MKRKNRKSSRSPRTIVLTIIALAGVAYYAVSRLPQAKPVPISINEVAVIPATVTLSLPPTVSAAPGVESSVDLTIDTGSAQVSAVQVELSYDPSKLTGLTLTQGDFLPNKLGTPKIGNGLISFVYAVPMGSSAKSGTGRLATLKFKSTSGDSQITFTKNTMVAAIGTNVNVLKSATGANLLSGSTAASVTPPALTDIQPAPALAPPPTTPIKAGVSAPASPTTDSRVFNAAGNFDYSKSAPAPTPTTTPTSAFARFLATIKAFFGSK